MPQAQTLKIHLAERMVPHLAPWGTSPAS